MIVAIYVLLYLITIYVIFVSWTIVKKTQSLVPVAPIAVMYFWSFMGAWSWIPMKLKGEQHFYEDIAFTVNVDGYYLSMLLLYFIFVFSFCTTIMILIRFKRGRISNKKEVLCLYYDAIDKLLQSKLYFCLLGLLLGGFVYFYYRDISSAMFSDVSAYKLSRFDSSIGTSESMVQFFGDTFTYLAVPMLFAKNNKKRKIVVVLMLIVFFAFNFLLGNRNILLCGMVIGGLFYSELNGVKRIFRPRNIVLGITLLVLIQFISFVRGASVNALLSGDFEFKFTDVLGSTTNSAEQYAAQISMYGVLKKDVPYTYGSSVLYFFSSFIPSVFGIERPDRIYPYYVQHTVGHQLDIGITCHHATAWYINFGLVGIILGGILWGVVLSYLYKRRLNYIYLYGAVLFSAVSIQMIRDAGPESYKGCLILATIVPMTIAWYCLKKQSKKSHYRIK